MPDDLRLSLRAVRAFSTVVDRGSISAAAEALNTVPSAVAALVSQVEAEMGADLLVRTRARGVSATAEGRALADRFRTLLDDYAEILAEGRDRATTLSGTLRIGYYAPVAPAFLPAILRPLIRANPGLRLDLQEHDNDSVQEALLSGRTDAILFAAQGVRGGIVTRPLLDLPPYALLPHDHPLASHRDVTLCDLAEHPLIKLDRPLARSYVDGLFAARNLSPRIAALADSTEMVRSLVGAGLGVAVLNMCPVTVQTYAGDTLVMRPLDADLSRLALHSGHATVRPRRLVTTFLEALHEWMESPRAGTLTVPPPGLGVGSKY